LKLDKLLGVTLGLILIAGLGSVAQVYGGSCSVVVGPSNGVPATDVTIDRTSNTPPEFDTIDCEVIIDDFAPPLMKFLTTDNPPIPGGLVADGQGSIIKLQEHYVVGGTLSMGAWSERIEGSNLDPSQSVIFTDDITCDPVCSEIFLDSPFMVLRWDPALVPGTMVTITKHMLYESSGTSPLPLTIPISLIEAPNSLFCPDPNSFPNHQTGLCECDQGFSPNPTTGICELVVSTVGGEMIPIETTSLILAGAQTFSWMIPVVLSVLGIGLFVVSRKSE